MSKEIKVKAVMHKVWKRTVNINSLPILQIPGVEGQYVVSYVGRNLLQYMDEEEYQTARMGWRLLPLNNLSEVEIDFILNQLCPNFDVEAFQLQLELTES